MRATSRANTSTKNSMASSRASLIQGLFSVIFLFPRPNPSGSFCTSFAEFEPTPNSDDEKSDSAETARSNPSPDNEAPTSPADRPANSTEGQPGQHERTTQSTQHVILLDDVQADPAARPDGDSLSERSPEEILLDFRPFCNPANFNAAPSGVLMLLVAPTGSVLTPPCAPLPGRCS